MSAAAVLEAPKLEVSSAVSIRLTAEETAALERYALTKKMRVEEALEELIREELIPLVRDYDLPDDAERRFHVQKWLNRPDLAWEDDGQ